MTKIRTNHCECQKNKITVLQKLKKKNKKEYVPNAKVKSRNTIITAQSTMEIMSILLI
jgi:uncharacterized protein with FMN-binding domain